MIRRVQEKDIPRLKELHAASGFAWEFPDLSAVPAHVVVDEHDQPVMLAGARPMAEVFSLFDKDWGDPKTKMQAFSALYEAMESDLRTLGIKEAVAWLPPQVWHSFGRRLKTRFGWVPNPWNCLIGFVKGG